MVVKEVLSDEVYSELDSVPSKFMSTQNIETGIYLERGTWWMHSQDDVLLDSKWTLSPVTGVLIREDT